MILIEKKIAEKTLGFLAKKSLSKLSVPEILKNTNMKFFILSPYVYFKFFLI